MELLRRRKHARQVKDLLTSSSTATTTKRNEASEVMEPVSAPTVEGVRIHAGKVKDLLASSEATKRNESSDMEPLAAPTVQGIALPRWWLDYMNLSLPNHTTAEEEEAVLENPPTSTFLENSIDFAHKNRKEVGCVVIDREPDLPFETKQHASHASHKTVWLSTASEEEANSSYNGEITHPAPEEIDQEPPHITVEAALAEIDGASLPCYPEGSESNEEFQLSFNVSETSPQVLTTSEPPELASKPAEDETSLPYPENSESYDKLCLSSTLPQTKPPVENVSETLALMKADPEPDSVTEPETELKGAVTRTQSSLNSRSIVRKAYHQKNHDKASCVLEPVQRRSCQSNHNRLLLKFIVKVRSLARGHKKRRDLQTRHNASINIQAMMRVSCQSLLYRLKRETSIYLQTAFRRSTQKKKYVQLLCSVVVLQKWARSMLCRLRFLKSEDAANVAATRISVACRGWVERSQYRRKREAVLLLQSIVRWAIACQQADERKQSIMRIQSFIRGYQPRQDLHTGLKASSKIRAAEPDFVSLTAPASEEALQNQKGCQDCQCVIL